MRIVTWNLRRATKKSDIWRTLLDLNPDIILLQEVVEFPSDITSVYEIEFRTAINKKNLPQKFGTAILVKGSIISSIPLISELTWANELLKCYSDNIPACKIQLENGKILNVISVYSPAWPVSSEHLNGVDVTSIKLSLNKNLWCTELLWSALKNTSISTDNNWIIGGDFNSSETFDYLWKGGPSGNLEIIERMIQLGLNECLKSYKGKLTPTFKNPKGGKIIHQIDHLYVSNGLYKLLDDCFTGDSEIIFGKSLSDHLPIIADFQ